MAQQDIRYYLNGLLLLMEENQTEGRRDRRPSAGICPDDAGSALRRKREVILPRKVVLELARLLE